MGYWLENNKNVFCISFVRVYRILQCRRKALAVSQVTLAAHHHSTFNTVIWLICPFLYSKVALCNIQNVIIDQTKKGVMKTLSDDSYPSGNLAIIVVQKKKCRVCIVHEDKPSYAEIQAIFKSDGRSTCYYPNGTVWYV